MKNIAGVYKVSPLMAVGKPYHLPYNITAVEMIIKWGGGRECWWRKLRFGVGKENQFVGFFKRP